MENSINKCLPYYIIRRVDYRILSNNRTCALTFSKSAFSGVSNNRTCAIIRENRKQYKRFDF